MTYINLGLVVIKPLLAAGKSSGLDLQQLPAGRSDGSAVGIKAWATEKLRTGDLTTLAAITAGNISDDKVRIARLEKRGFIAVKTNGSFKVTLQGRIALLIKRLLLS